MKGFLSLLLALFAGLPVVAAESAIIAAGAELQKLAGEFSFTEGPACDPKGNVFFTDQPSDRILKWSIEGKLSTFKQPCGRANGLSFDSQGELWACADEKNELWRIDAEGKMKVVVKDYQGKLLNGPNDVWVRPNLRATSKGSLRRVGQPRDAVELPAGLYFTDPYYKRNYWKRGDKEMPECVYHLGADGKTLTRVIEDLKQPNGIIGTPDGRTLYVADIGASKTYRYSIQRDGALTGKKLFCELGSDGMTIDNRGNVYLTGKGVSVFDGAGNQREHIEVPEPWTANVCFGGRDRQTLFMTASKGLYALRMKVKGVDSQ